MIEKFRFGILKTALALAFLACNMVMFAQPPGGPPPGGGGTTGTTPPCWEPECIPIDGGLMFLLIAGVALGAYQIYSRTRGAKA